MKEGMKEENPAFHHSNMATSHTSNDKKNTSCLICNDALKNPSTIPCGHIFCLECILDCWKLDSTNYICPECGQEFSHRPGLIKKITLAEVKKDKVRRKRTEPCSSGSVEPKKKNHSSTETSAKLLCPHHKSPMDVYCVTDNHVQCALCASGNHAGHKFGVVKKKWRKKQEKLGKVQTKLKTTLQKGEEELENMKEILELIQVKAKETEDHCESVIVRVIDYLQRHFMAVKQRIGAQVEVAVTKVHTSQYTIKMKIDKLKAESAELESFTQSETNADFLQKWAQVQHLCEKDYSLPNQEDLEDLFIPFEDTKHVVEKLGKQLEDFCDKNFVSVNSAADQEKKEELEQETRENDTEQTSEANPPMFYGLSSIMLSLRLTLNLMTLSYIAHVPEELDEWKRVPKTREEFLQYACELSLDLATAHEDLTITKGDTEVTLLPQNFKFPAVRSPQRFIRRRQVLCREGLQAERCYFEVKVKGNKMEIALTYKGIDRKSFSKFSAFGANSNSWSLDRSDRYSVSHNGNSIMLSALPSHHIIGVYLEFNEGALYFYEVSDSMKFLYKLKAKFREPLYPGFWLSENCCIRIRNLKKQRQ